MFLQRKYRKNILHNKSCLIYFKALCIQHYVSRLFVNSGKKILKKNLDLLSLNSLYMKLQLTLKAKASFILVL